MQGYRNNPSMYQSLKANSVAGHTHKVPRLDDSTLEIDIGNIQPAF
jgi:hypothetical protein